MSLSSQGYEFAIQHNGNYDFSIVAIPDFNATNTDISDIGFTLMLPAGNADVTSAGNFNGRVWGIVEANATQLTNLGLGDGSRDAFVINLPPGQTILSHTSGVPFTLVSFQISNMPDSGEMSILPNSDAIAMGLGGAADSFFNSNIDNTSTDDYFSGIASGQGSFMFDTLSTAEVNLSEESIKIYPNPTNEYIYIQTDNLIDKIEVYNILGKRVIQTKNNNKINLSNLNDGTYIVKVFSNTTEFIRKIVKH